MKTRPPKKHSRTTKSNVQYLTNEKGEKTAIVISIQDYEKLIEDLDDLAVVAERRAENTIPHEQFKRDLRRNAISH
jgi:hypothetical protein